MMVTSGSGEWNKENYCLIGVQFQIYKSYGNGWLHDSANVFNTSELYP